MSDERIKEVISKPAAAPSQPSIMSAPREHDKTKKFIIVLFALIISVIINVLLLISLFSKNEQIEVLQSTIKKRENFITELENKLKESSSL